MFYINTELRVLTLISTIKLQLFSYISVVTTVTIKSCSAQLNPNSVFQSAKEGPATIALRCKTYFRRHNNFQSF